MSPWIIDRLPCRKPVREERPVLQLPVSVPEVDPSRAEEDEAEDEAERGIAVIDFYI